jgi:hypothetical protein
VVGLTATADMRFTALSKRARPYPSYLLPDEGSALALFAAGFMGWNDAVHFARQGLAGTCVDVDAERLFDMSTIYPEGWSFHVEDAWEYAERAHERGEQWDVVSVDPFMGDAAERAWRDLYLWCALARSLVTLTVSSETHLNAPEGWTGSFFPRGSSAAWLVMQRA